jgi:hypothetical protein
VLIAYDPMVSLTVNGGSGNNTFTMQGNAAGTTTTVNAGMGNDTVNVPTGVCLSGPLVLHGQAGTMAAADNADQAAQDSDTMSCCPAPGKGAVVAVDHPSCCSVSNDAEQPVAFLVSSERPTPHPLDVAAVAAGGLLPTPAHYFGELRSTDGPRFVNAILELKTDLRI